MKVTMEAGSQARLAQIRRQLGQVGPRALNDALFAARPVIQDHMRKSLDRPTPAVISAVRVEKADVGAGLQATGALYLGHPDPSFQKRLNAIGRLQEEGGQLMPGQVDRKKLAVPVGIRRNGFGGMPRGALRRLLDGKRTFIVEAPGGRAGVYQGDPSGDSKLMAWLIPSARYKPRLQWRRTAERAVARALPEALARRIDAIGNPGGNAGGGGHGSGE